MDVIAHNEIDGNQSVFIRVPNFLTHNEIEQYRTHLKATSEWKFGELHGRPINRAQRWYHDDGKYFSNLWKGQDFDRWKSNQSEQWLIDLREKVQQKVNIVCQDICSIPQFNSVLVNYYRNGTDTIKHHRDDETIFGDNPTIAMLTFGQVRPLQFRRIIYNPNDLRKIENNLDETELNKTFEIQEGELFIMAGAVQKYYSHGIEKDSTINGRYSVTIREHKQI